MTFRANSIVPTLFVLAMASAPTQAEIFKCRQGERVIYQSSPCPADSQSGAIIEVPPQPSAYEVEQARQRAKGDINEATALRKRDEKADQVLDRKRAAAHKQEVDCARLLDKIEKAEAKPKLSKAQKGDLKSEQRNYRKECGPL
jgi:hypothetical protein